MSYADVSIDLTSIGVVCLTGLNGSGKSALLDAITWAIWEEARASSEELVRLGQTEMWVDLCFELEDRLYRVRRARQKAFGRGGQHSGTRGNLDLQMWNSSAKSRESSSNAIAPGCTNASSANSDDGSWMSLTAASMRETQQRLKDLLRMDYDTFITSVYLRQGRADEFTMRSPNERKQVLADILGLDCFDRLQDICKENMRECRARIQLLEAGLAACSDLEREIGESSTECESLAGKLQTITVQFNDSVRKQSALEEEIARLKYLQVREETARARARELKSDIESLRRRITGLNEVNQKLAGLVQEADQVMARLQEFEACKGTVEHLDVKAVKHSELTSRRMDLRGRLATIRARLEVELEHLGALIEAKSARKHELEKSCSGLERLESAYQEYRRLLEAELAMSRRRETFTVLQARADELEAMIGETRIRLEAQNQQKEMLLTELEEVISQESQIEKEQQALQAELQAIDQVEVEFELVEEKGIKLKTRIETHQQMLVQIKKKIHENEQKMQELCRTPDLSNCPLCQAPIVDSKAVLDRYRQENLCALSSINGIETEIAGLAEERDLLRRHYIELRNRLLQRKALDIKIGEFNERKSAIERATATRDELKRELELSRRKLETHMFAPVEQESLVRVKAELAKLDFDPIIFSSFQAQMRSQRHIELRYQQIQRDLKELGEIQAEIPLLEETSRKLEGDLKNGQFAPNEKSEAENLDAAIAELDYRNEDHQEQKRRLLELFPVVEKARDIQKAQADLPDVQHALFEILQMVHEREEEMAQLDAESREWLRRLDDLPALKADLKDVQEKHQSLEPEKEDLQKRLLLIETRLAHLRQNKSNFDSQKKLLAESIKEMEENGQLAEAFGKKGIQAIIIENAIPEIEAEANRILARLTENRMHLALLTQQRTRQGSLVETLDIVIADELGTRSYELYSGGEAFRVNFALRLALSRLLARRAGARLETLIIDEGFGSQDEQSRSKLLRSIASIKPDFARIIVVTHISQVKDMFPVQIVVHKEEGVSKVDMLLV